MTNNSDSNENKSPLIKQLKLTAYGVKSAYNSKSSSHIAAQPDSELVKLASALNALAFSNLTSFDRDIQCLWNDPPIDDRDNLQMVDRSLRFLEANAVKMVSEGMERCVDISMSHEAFIIFSDILSEFYSSSAGVVLDHSASSQRMGFNTFSDAQLSEVRRRMDRRIDAYRPRFVDVLEMPSHRAETERDKGGRPPESNWDEMETYVLAQFPAGLPTTRGTKAKIAAFFSLWLRNEKLPSPDLRHLDRKAAELYNRYHNLKK